MSNQRLPGKKQQGLYMLEHIKKALSQNAKVHGVHVSDIIKATTSDYMRLSNKRQRRLIDAWEGRREESE